MNSAWVTKRTCLTFKVPLTVPKIKLHGIMENVVQLYSFIKPLFDNLANSLIINHHKKGELHDIRFTKHVAIYWLAAIQNILYF